MLELGWEVSPLSIKERERERKKERKNNQSVKTKKGDLKFLKQYS